jgi:hypothetical protein
MFMEVTLALLARMLLTVPCLLQLDHPTGDALLREAVVATSIVMSTNTTNNKRLRLRYILANCATARSAALQLSLRSYVASCSQIASTTV